MVGWSLLPFLPFVSCVVSLQGLLHNLCLFFDIVFPQLGVIPGIRSIEIVAVVERYVVISHAKNKESKKQKFRICLPVIICLSWWKNNNKKGRNFFVPSLKFCQFRQNGRKSRIFFMKTSWIWTCSQIFRKLSFWENLRLF